MFVGQHQLGGRRDGAGSIAVQYSDLVRPLPDFIAEIEAIPPDVLQSAASEGLLDRCLPFRTLLRRPSFQTAPETR